MFFQHLHMVLLVVGNDNDNHKKMQYYQKYETRIIAIAVARNSDNNGCCRRHISRTPEPEPYKQKKYVYIYIYIETYIQVVSILFSIIPIEPQYYPKITPV